MDRFRQVSAIKGQYHDASLYWLAYAQNRMGERPAALATLLELGNTYPKSKWAADGKALELEIRQSSGQTVRPEDVSDEDVKLMAVNALMHTKPERAIPLLEQILSSNQSQRVKDKAMFVLSQSSGARAVEILGRIARDGSKPELQSRALRYLGMRSDDEGRRVLAEVYASTGDRKIKSSVLKSYMISGDSGRLLALAKTESDPTLRGDAVKQLGVMGARNELAALYTSERAVEVREQIIKALFLSGAVDKLSEIARTETVTALRLAAIRNLGLVGGAESTRTLLSLYGTDAAVSKAVIQGLFLQSNAKALIDLARKEKNPAMKKEIVSKLSVMGSDEATEYMLELLRD